MPIKSFAKKTIKLSTATKPGAKLNRAVRSPLASSVAANISSTEPSDTTYDTMTFEQDTEFFLSAVGCSRQRPEILLNLGFLPLYDSTGNSRVPAIADLFETQKNCRGLYYDNNNTMLEKMFEDASLEDEVAFILEKTSRQMEEARKDIEHLSEIRRMVNMIKRDLDLKLSGPAMIDRINKKNQVAFDRKTEKLEKKVEDQKAKAEAAQASGGNVSYFLRAKNRAQRDLDELRLSDMPDFHTIWTDTGFTETNYKNFSNTKLIAQLIQDMYFTMTSNSPAILGNTFARRYDSHPFAVHAGPYSGRKVGECFMFSEFSGPEHRATYETYNNMTEKLPTNAENRIKILVNSLAREARMSLAMTKKAKRDNARMISDLTGDAFFGAVFGSPSSYLSGDEILQGLSTILKIEVGDVEVLPFEPAYVKSADGETLYSPGTTRIAEEVLTSGALNHGPLMGLAANFIEQVMASAAGTRAVNRVGRLPRGAIGAHEAPLRNFRWRGGDFMGYINWGLQFVATKMNTMMEVGEVAQGWGPMGAFLLLIEKSADNAKLRFALYKYVQVMRTFVILQENEALEELIAEDEEVQEEHRRQQLLLSLNSPAYKSAAITTALDSMMSMADEEEEVATVDIDVNSIETSADAMTALQEIVDLVLDLGFFSDSPSQSAPAGAPSFNSNPSAARSPDAGRPSFKPVEWYQNDGFVVRTQTVRADMVDPESEISKLFFRVFKKLVIFKRLGKAYRDLGALHDAHTEHAFAGRGKEVRALRGKAAMADAVARTNLGHLQSTHGTTSPNSFLVTTHVGPNSYTHHDAAAQAAFVMGHAARNEAAAARQEADTLEMAISASRRNAVQALPDFFETADPDTGLRLSVHNGVNEEVYDMAMFDCMLTLISEFIDVKIESAQPHRHYSGGGTYLDEKFIRFSFNATVARGAKYALQFARGKRTKALEYEESIEDIELETYTDLLTKLIEIRRALTGEGRFMHRSWTILRTIGDMLSRRATITHEFFDLSSTVGNETKVLMKSLMDQADNDGKLVIASLNRHQIAWKHYAIENMGELPKDSGKCPYPGHKMISAEQMLFLEQVLKSRSFRSGRGSNVNIIAVGLPTGMMKHLSTETFEDSDTAQMYDPYAKNKLLKINVYKRDIQFDDIVFKPIGFFFDPNRHFSPLDSYTEILPDDNLSTIITERLNFIEYMPKGRTVEEGEKYSDVMASDDFAILDTAAKRARCISNMVNSEAMKIYTKITTGIDLNEQSFYLHPAGKDHFKGELDADLDAVNSLFQTQEEIDTEEELLKNAARISQLNCFSESTLFKGSNLRREAISPVLFERIYCLPVDPDDFIIDVKKTMSTTSGKEAFRTALDAKKIIKQTRNNGKTIYKMAPRRKSEGSVAVYEYFTSVKLLKSDISNRSKTAERKMVAETEPPESYSYVSED